MIPRMEPCPGPDDRPGYLVSTPYREDFIFHLKELVPSPDRRWWEDSRGWWVAESYEDDVGQLLLCHFDDYELVEEDGTALIVNRRGERIRQGSLFG